MTTDAWVTERLSVVSTEEPTLFGQSQRLSSGATATAAHTHGSLFGSAGLGRMLVAGPSTFATVGGPSVKRASAEKCLEKEKAGKGSGVGSTASKRVSSARKKATKARAVDPATDADGPAQAVLKRRAAQNRVDYKRFM